VVLLLAIIAQVNALYLETAIPVCVPNENGAAFWPTTMVYDSLHDRVHAYGRWGWSAVIDCALNRVVGDVPVALTGNWADYGRSLWSRTNDKVYLRTYHDVTIINSLDSIVARVPAGRYGPGGIAFNDSENCLAVVQLSATQTDTGQVLIVDGQTDMVRAVISTGGYPYLVAWDWLDNRYYVVQSAQHDLSGPAYMAVIDGATNVVMDTFMVLPSDSSNWAQDLAYVPQNQKVYVAMNRHVVAIDTRTNRLVTELPFCGGARPRLVWHPTLDKLYCLGETMLVVDCRTDSVVARASLDSLDSEWPYPAALDLTDDLLYTAGDGGASIFTVDCRTDSIISRRWVAVVQPYYYYGVPDMVWSPRHDIVYVALPLDVILEIDGRTNRIIDSISTDRTSTTVLWNPTRNRLYIRAPRYAPLNDDWIMSVDGATGRTDHWIRAGTGWTSMCLDSGGQKLYCTNENDGTVGVVDCVTETLVATIPVPFPTWLALNRSRNWLYCTSYDSLHAMGYLVVIDCVSDSIIAWVQLPYNSPQYAVWHSSVNKVYVVDANTGSVEVIDAVTNQLLTTLTNSVITRPPACNTRNNKLYVPEYSGGLAIYDAVRDTFIRQFTEFEAGWSPVWLPGVNKVYVGASGGPTSDCVAVLDGATDSLIKLLPVSGGQVTDLAVDSVRNRVYANFFNGNEGGGLVVIDGVRDSIVGIAACPNYSDLLGYTRTIAIDPSANRVYLAGPDHVFALRDESQGIVQQPRLPPDVTSFACLPSIATRVMMVRAELRTREPLKLTVFDRTGRQVKSFAPMNAVGSVTWRWNGDDDAGRRLAGGVYFVRLQVSQESLTRKVVLAQHD
jgi:YVTN family beta-propeller protein